MIKKVLTLLLVSLLLIGCRPVTHDNTSTSSYNILTYKSAASLILLPLLNESYSISASSSYDSFVQAFTEDKYDIIIAPINIGVNECQNAGNYKLLASVEYGTFKLAATREKYSTGTVGAIGQSTVCGSLIDFLAPGLKNYEIKWYNNIDEIKDDIVAGNLNGIIVDEINFNYLNDQDGIELFEIEDLTIDYEYEKTYSKYPVSGLFVSNRIIKEDQTNLVSFAKKLKSAINTYTNDKTTFNNVLISSDVSRLGFKDYRLIRESYNYCGLDFIYAESAYDELEALLDMCDIELDESIIIK